MGDSGSVEQSIAHHHISHRNLSSEKRKSNACNVSVLTGDADFAATIYGISNSGHHSHEHTPNSNTLSANSHRSSILTSEQQHHSGKSINSLTPFP